LSWDIALDKTGDWLFSGNRDILPVDGPALMHQRIMTRLRIPRGTVIFDEEGTLGSNLKFALRYNTERAQREVPMMVNEALDQISNEINISSVTLSLSNDNRQLMVDISYSIISVDDEAEVSTDEERSLQIAI
jgi:hypothetical protein